MGIGHCGGEGGVWWREGEREERARGALVLSALRTSVSARCSLPVLSADGPPPSGACSLARGAGRAPPPPSSPSHAQERPRGACAPLRGMRACVFLFGSGRRRPSRRRASPLSSLFSSLPLPRSDETVIHPSLSVKAGRTSNRAGVRGGCLEGGGRVWEETQEGRSPLVSAPSCVSPPSALAPFQSPPLPLVPAPALRQQHSLQSSLTA